MSTRLPAALDAPGVALDGRAGRLNVYVAGEGPPLLLIHSVNAAASAAEVRPLFDHYRSTRSVLAVDLPGFGGSDRSDRAYTPGLMTDAILAVLELAAERCGSVPVDALALSLSCEFLARAAAQWPSRFRSLALISPTGFNGHSSWRGPPGSTRGKPWVWRILRGPGAGWGEGLFKWLTRPGVIRYFLERTWGSRQIDEELWRYAVLTARQPGARHAPLHFLAANLFSADIHTVYEQLAVPVWMAHGVRGDFTDYRGQGLIQGRSNWRINVFDSGALPHFEVPQAFFEAFDGFLESVDRRATSAD